ncbi:MAG: zeta toxin family protein [Clostridia bacterium]|nr:zeta toxin family protein [Clostridia bacterium]
MANINNELEFIVENALKAPENLIEKSETRYKNIVENIAEKINNDSSKKIVMLAGPSGSGKTTTATKIKEKLESYGHKAYAVSLDDFYKNIGEGPKNEDGTYDFESVDSLDLDLIHKCLQELITQSESELPLFDFMTGRRKEEKNIITLNKDDVIIVEGLHALNPAITDTLPHENLFKIYISVSSRIYDGEKIVLNKRNLRFIRRMVRDFQFRNSPVEHTYSLWPKVMHGEDKYLFPFKSNADITANTIHIYEPCVLKKQALELLLTVEETSENYKDAQKLISALNKFPSIEKDSVPKDSLLREFLGE